jgi:hypothetical protein
VDWSDLADVSEGNRVHRHNRLVTNWVRERTRLNENGVQASLHRISSKRVILEITDVSPSQSSPAKRALCAVSLCSLLLACAVSFSYPQNPKETEVLVEQSAPACVEFDALSSGVVSEMANFRLATWRVKTFGAANQIGALISSKFEAACSGQLVSGRLVATRSAQGFEILKMTPAN